MFQGRKKKRFNNWGFRLQGNDVILSFHLLANIMMKDISKQILYCRIRLVLPLIIISTALNTIAMDSTPANNLDMNQSIRQGIHLYDNGKYQEALKYFISLDKSYPDNGNILYETANTYYAVKDYNNALVCAQRAGLLLPKSDKVNVLLGNIFDDLNKPEEALKQYMTAIKINPESDTAYYNLGIFYYNNGKYKEAEEAFINSCAFNEENLSNFYSLGYVYMRLNETDMTKEVFQRIIDMEKENERSVEVRNILNAIILSEQKK